MALIDSTDRTWCVRCFAPQSQPAQKGCKNPTWHTNPPDWEPPAEDEPDEESV